MKHVKVMSGLAAVAASGAVSAVLVAPAGAFVGPSPDWGSANCSATFVWNDPGKYSQSPTQTKPTGSGDPCHDINIQVTGGAYFQAVDTTTGQMFSSTYCSPGSPSGTTINALSTTVNGGNQFYVQDNSSQGESTRLDF